MTSGGREAFEAMSSKKREFEQGHIPLSRHSLEAEYGRSAGERHSSMTASREGESFSKVRMSRESVDEGRTLLLGVIIGMMCVEKICLYR